MPKPISPKKLIKKLRAFDFDGPYSGGKHSFMITNNIKLRVPHVTVRALQSMMSISLFVMLLIHHEGVLIIV